MTFEEIKVNYDLLVEKLKKETEGINSTTFVLNPKIDEIRKEMLELQDKCEHSFTKDDKNKQCEHCKKIKD